AERMIPSAYRSPRASSMSAPGVRMTTASGAPSRSSWRGSSVTTAAGDSVHAPAAKRRIRKPGAAALRKARYAAATRVLRADPGAAQDPLGLAAQSHGMTLGPRRLEGVAYSLHRLLELLPDDPVNALGDGEPDHRGRRLIHDPEPDVHALGDLRERETPFLLDQTRFRDPTDLMRLPPAVESQDAAEGEAHRRELDFVTGADSGRTRANWLPVRHALENLRHMVVVG